MQTILLAGGLGSRLAEETVSIPKPMVEIGGQPIIMHVMDIYRHWGYRDFIVAAGYKSLLLKRFFSDLYLINNDFTISLKDGAISLKPTKTHDWNVSVVDTGINTMTGGRLLRLRDWIGGKTFMVTYSDGVGNIDIEKLVAFHRSHGKLATVTAVKPPARFGGLALDGTRVSAFTEKVETRQTWINGGFFVFEPGILDYIPGDHEPLEHSPLARIAEDGELQAFLHHGFWHPMDTIRDRTYLNSLAEKGNVPWMRFGEGDAG